MGYECVFNGDCRVNTQPDRPRAWTKKEVDGLMFRLLQTAYKSDKTTVHFIIKQLREELLRELTIS